MTNYNKINSTQKIVLAEYMRDHPNLAKNLLPNTCQGKATSIRMWESLATKLNTVGPPVKEVKAWKKVFADQKFQTKKKLSFNKASKNKTGGGPYEEKNITEEENLLIEATGLEASVKGLSNAKTFGSSQLSGSEPNILTAARSTGTNDSVEDSLRLILGGYSADSHSEQSIDCLPASTSKTATKSRKKQTARSSDDKLALLEENIRLGSEFHKSIEGKLNRLLDIQERVLVMKEEKHKNYIAVQAIELQIKTLQLEMLKNNTEED